LIEAKLEGSLSLYTVVMICVVMGMGAARIEYKVNTHTKQIDNHETRLLSEQLINAKQEGVISATHGPYLTQTIEVTP